MKNRIKKQKCKILLSVISVLLVAWIVVSVTFGIIVINLELDSQVNKEKYIEEQIMSYIDGGYWDFLFYGVDRARQDSILRSDLAGNGFNAEYDTDMQIVIFEHSSNQSKKVWFNTAESVTARFWGLINETDEQFMGVLDFDSFKASFTDEQYKTVEEYLGKVPSENGEQYHLVATRFYFDEESLRLIPETVEIVLADENDYWYSSAGVEATFTLNPGGTEGLTLHTMDNDHFNDIPSVFVLGKFTNGNVIDDANEPVYFENMEEYIATVDNPVLENPEPFVYIYRNINDISVRAVDTYVETENGGYAEETEYYGFYVKYAKRLNVLEECKDFLVFGLGGIFLFFLLLGTVLAVMLLKVMDTQTRAEQKRREVTNALAHDIKTPLFIIEGYAQSLRENINTDKQIHYADRIIERTKEVNGLVHKMLDFSKLDSPDFALMKESVDIAGLINSLLDDYKKLDGNKSIKLSMLASPTVNADKGLMTRAFTNLLENAVRYSDARTVISIEITEKSFSISNASSTVTEKNLKRLTEPYYRGEENRESKGNGLGLSVVKSICDMHGFGFGISLDGNVIKFSIEF